MKFKNPLLATALLLSFTVSAQDSPPIYDIVTEPGKSLSWELNLEKGGPMKYLDWAWMSNNACFPETQKMYFTGNHLLLRTEIPAYSTMVIRLIPQDVKENFSLYAYSGGHGSLPPNLSSCVSCEADSRPERRIIGRERPDHERRVELRAVRNPYPITIGIAGAEGLTEGYFTVEVTITKNR